MSQEVLRGNLIVFYGVNNLGKTTQARLLVDRLNASGRKSEYIKYARYDLEPSGPLINSYLRQGNPYGFSAREFQILQVLNRQQFQNTLLEKLENGVYVVAEDYTGTGIAWGMASGVDRSFLEKISSRLIKEDFSLFFYGNRFGSGKEKSHTHESDDTLTKKAIISHETLANDYGWQRIDANRSIEEISKEIYGIVCSLKDKCL